MHLSQSILIVSLLLSGCVVAFDREFDFDQDGADSSIDCDDEDPAVHPAAVELCADGIDQDCNTRVDDCAGDDDAVDEVNEDTPDLGDDDDDKENSGDNGNHGQGNDGNRGTTRAPGLSSS